MNFIKCLEVFHMIRREGSLTQAAKELNMAPSGISRILNELEEHLGYALFTRSPKGLTLTEKGRLLLPKAEKILEETYEILNFSALNQNNPHGLFKITAPSLFGEKYITPIIVDLLNQYPHLNFDLTLNDRIQDIKLGQFDLAIRIGMTTTPSLTLKKIASNQRILVASPEYLDNKSLNIRHITDINQCEGLFGGPQNYWQVKNNQNTSFTITPKIRLNLRGTDRLVYFCKKGLGVALISSCNIQKELNEGSLIQLFPEFYDTNPADIYAVYIKKREYYNILQIFLERLKHQLSVGIKEQSPPQ